MSAASSWLDLICAYRARLHAWNSSWICTNMASRTRRGRRCSSITASVIEEAGKSVVHPMFLQEAKERGEKLVRFIGGSKPAQLVQAVVDIWATCRCLLSRGLFARLSIRRRQTTVEINASTGTPCNARNHACCTSGALSCATVPNRVLIWTMSWAGQEFPAVRRGSPLRS